MEKNQKSIGSLMGIKKGKSKQKFDNDSAIKGKVVEMIVAAMHEFPNITVQRNVRLPAIRSAKRKREIDVLLTATPVRVAIECKNYKKIIDVPHIDAYFGKLHDVGIPSEQGIFVSAGGFTDGALERANELGITPLILSGLTPDRLGAQIFEAIQSVVYLIVEITNLEIVNNIPEAAIGALIWFLYDSQGNARGSIPDRVWKQWIEGFPPSTLGEYEFDVALPDELYHSVGGVLHPIISAKVRVKVTGLVAEFQGKATQHVLINPLAKAIDRFKAEVSFGIPDGVYPLLSFEKETALQNHLETRPESVKLASRFRLPRISFYSIYWPLSKNAAVKLYSISRQCYEEGRIATDKELASIEGNDLKAVWEPVWEGNPILQEL